MNRKKMDCNANSVMRRSHNYGTVSATDLNYGLKCSLYIISYMCFSDTIGLR